MEPDDIPTEITQLVYTAPPVFGSRIVPSQNEAAVQLAHYWPAIEKYLRARHLLEAETLARHEGNRLYNDMGQKAAQGAWRVADLLALVLTPNGPEEPVPAAEEAP